MPVIYNNKRIVPAPILTIEKTYRRLGNSQKVKPLWNLTVNGKFLANMGSPINRTGDELNLLFQGSGSGVRDYPADSTDWNIPDDGQHMVMTKQQAVEALFSEDYKAFEILPWGGQQPSLRCFPRVGGITYPEGLWYKQCDYSVKLEAEFIVGPSVDESPNSDIFSVDSGNIGFGDFDFVSDYNVEDATESFSLEMDSENYGVFKATHNVSAKGYRSLDSIGNVTAEAHENARTFVLDRLGFNPTFIQSSVFGNLSGTFNAYNHYRTQNEDIYNGNFSATETWTLASGNYYEEYSAEVKQTVQDPYRTVTCQGTVNGLTNFVVGTDSWTPTGALLKYNSASGAYFGTIQGNIYTRAQNYIGIQLNPIPLDSTVTHNFNKGIISYGFSYNSRPLNLVSGTISEVLNINDSNIDGAAQVIASHTILNRDRGPIFQDINTTPETSRSISYECVLSGVQYPSGNDIVYLMSLNPRTQVLSLFSGLAPTNYYPGYRFLVQDDESFSPLALRYSLNRKYLYERL